MRETEIDSVQHSASALSASAADQVHPESAPPDEYTCHNDAPNSCMRKNGTASAAAACVDGQPKSRLSRASASSAVAFDSQRNGGRGRVSTLFSQSPNKMSQIKTKIRPRAHTQFEPVLYMRHGIKSM